LDLSGRIGRCLAVAAEPDLIGAGAPMSQAIDQGKRLHPNR